MAHLGTIEGHGQIIAGGNDLGVVDYSIAVFQSGSMREARGYITGPEKVLIAASMAGGAILQLEGGRTVDVLVSVGASGNSNRAHITVSGPVPGF